MKLMWSSPEEGETDYYPWVGNGTMEAAQHIVAWATFALGAVHACQRMRDEFKDGLTLIGLMRRMAADGYTVGIFIVINLPISGIEGNDYSRTIHLPIHQMKSVQAVQIHETPVLNLFVQERHNLTKR